MICSRYTNNHEDDHIRNCQNKSNTNLDSYSVNFLFLLLSVKACILLMYKHVDVGCCIIVMWVEMVVSVLIEISIEVPIDLPVELLIDLLGN